MMLAMSPASQRSPADPASEKRSLASILRDHGPLPVIDAVDIALDVCDELANAHVNGIVHGDLGLHRVRTHWPRVPKQRADIFALGENDSAAFAFRASAVSILVAPEQRAGAAVDTRVDVWAVGAILHWLIAGVAPSADPLEQTLARAPRTLVITVAACLAEDPGKRPQSVNEIAEALGSFASSPADRFEQLARRRALIENAKRVRSDLGDVDRVLGRLDDAALAVHESTGSLIFDDSGSVTDLVDEDDDASDAETVLAQPSFAELHASERGEIIASPLSISPVVLSSELLAPPKPPVAPAARRVAPVPPVAAPERTKRSTVALAIVGAALAVSLGVGIGMHLVEGALARHDTAAADVVSGAGASTSGAAVSGAGTSTSGAAVSGAGTSVSGAAVSGAGTSVSGAGTSTSGAAASGAGTSAGATLAVASPNGAPPAPSLGASPATEAPSVMSVTSLPDARPVAPSSLPDARPLTPSSLPDARPAAPRSALPARANAAPRPSPPRAPESAAEGETVPAGFKSFDGASR